MALAGWNARPAETGACSIKMLANKGPKTSEPFAALGFFNSNPLF